MGINERSQYLREKANFILNNWKLLEFLSKYGESYLVGSVALDLMTWPDIDIEVICSSKPTKNDAIDVARNLFSRDGVRKVTPIDYSDSDGIKKPKGLYIGVEYKDKDENKWKMDIWLLTKDSARAREETISLASKLTPEYKTRIIKIKSVLHDHPQYRKDVISMDIYNAVMKNNVENLDDFKTYMQSKGVEIDL